MKFGRLINHMLNTFIAISLAFMSLLVFGNVVLRYGFNSGITWSEEMARFLFIWLVFLGAIAAMKDNQHLGVDMLLKRVPPVVRRAMQLLGAFLILYVLWLVLDGSWKMTMLNINSHAPATNLPLAFIYGIGIVTSISMGAIIAFKIYRFIVRRDDTVFQTLDSEEVVNKPVEAGDPRA
jgi:TRAP-type C4-dicarboxylate transport system permease small subunit